MYISAVLSFGSHSLPSNVQILPLPFYTTNNNKNKTTTAKQPNPLY